MGLVPTTDDPSTPSLSFRVMFIGTSWCIFLSIANAIFSFRTTSFSIPGFLATLLAYPMGIFMARVLPRRSFRTFGYDWTLNAGPFSIKEHVLTYIIASGGAGIAYGLDNVVTQRLDLFMVNIYVFGRHSG